MEADPNANAYYADGVFGAAKARDQLAKVRECIFLLLRFVKLNAYVS